MRISVIFLTFLVGICAAQDTTIKSVDAQPVGVVQLLDSSNQTLKPLPDEAWKVGHSSIFKTAYGKSPMTASIDVSGEHSTFRVAAGKPEFVFTFGSPENARLYVSESNKNERRFPSVRVNKDNSMVKLPGVAVEVTQIGDATYKLVPTSPLPPGEYAIILERSSQASNHRIFTFGID